MFDGFHGSVIPTAITNALQEYSPSDVETMKPSSSFRVDSQRQPYRTSIAARCVNSVKPRSISGRAGKYEVPSMNSGTSARSFGSSPMRLFQSYHSYGRV